MGMERNKQIQGELGLDGYAQATKKVKESREKAKISKYVVN